MKTSCTTSSPVAWSPTMNAASLTSPGRCTRYASAKPDPADGGGPPAVSSGLYRPALGLLPPTLPPPLIGCLRPLSAILPSPGWGANTSPGGIGELTANDERRVVASGTWIPGRLQPLPGGARGLLGVGAVHG